MPRDPRRTRSAKAAAEPTGDEDNEDNVKPMETTDTGTTTSSKPILLSGEDAMDEDEDMDMPPPTATTAVSSTAVSSTTLGSAELISTIITPSPYPQHNEWSTSSRFRNALNRVTANPTSDVEAWQALMTEVQSCYRTTIPSIHAVDAETHLKLDWTESCYGALLKTFPYAASYYAAIVEILMAQSARVGEENGPLADYGMEISRRSLRCEAKVEHIFRTVLGVEMDGTPVGAATAGEEDGDEDKAAQEGDKDAKDKSATELLGGLCCWSVELWSLYIKKCIRDATRTAASTISPNEQDEQAAFIRKATTKAYEVALSYAGFCHNNQLLWKQYLAFIKSWIPDLKMNVDHALAREQMEQLRAVYQRLVCLPMTGLDQLWQEYETFERGQSEALADALIREYTPKYQHARTVYLERNRVYGAVDLELDRLAIEPVADTSEDDYASKMDEEYKLLKLWKTRCSYERTNPERLKPSDFVQRVRTAYKEMLCVLTRHPECWHMWSTWELNGVEDDRTEKAVAVLRLGQTHIPDCTLLAYAEANIVELHTDKPEECITVMEKFIERSPNTLSFVLCQKMVRRHKGIDEARAVFARARRTLVDAGSFVRNEEKKKETTDGVEGEVGDTREAEHTSKKEKETEGNRWIITNRLDPSISGKAANGKKAETEEESANESSAGPVTWHLYASHALIEHRLNRCPEVAARVYELGLRKHSSFLTKPPYVMRYAQLLLELGDSLNLRALLTRAVAACDSAKYPKALAALWDMSLRFESVLSADKTTAAHLQEIEQKRRQAVMGGEIEDTAVGGLLANSDVPLIGAQKATISEQLVRAEGYDVSSKISSGMSRTVDFLEIMGLWGGDSSNVASSRQRGKMDDSDLSGGKSDSVFNTRLQYQNMAAAGLSSDAAAGEVGPAGTKVLSARERLQQGAAISGAPGQPTAMMLSIQQSPEWLRPLLLLLPASSLRVPIVPKPPPHLTEMALSSLRQNPLPAERPADTDGESKKRKVGGGGDSSDEEDGGGTGAGYSNYFRSRQRSRMSEQNGHTD